MERFDGRVVVITGAAGGIGRAAVERLAALGARVVAVDVDDAGLDAARQAAESAGAEVLAVRADTSRSDDVRRYVREAEARFGGIDALFNNAGIEGPVAPLESYPEEAFDRVLAVNVRGVFLGMKYVIPVLLQRGGGAIVNTASVAGVGGAPFIPAYAASKHAVIGLTRSAAMGYAARDIRVNAICPAPVETRMMRSLEEGLLALAGEGDPKQRITAGIPAARYGKPEEVASLVAFLLSDEARYVNGAAYLIDGAMTAG